MNRRRNRKIMYALAVALALADAYLIGVLWQAVASRPVDAPFSTSSQQTLRPNPVWI